MTERATRAERAARAAPAICRLAILAALGLLLAGATTARAQSYTWTDENGRVHMTDDEHSIPEKHRAKAQKRANLSVQVITPPAAPDQAEKEGSLLLQVTLRLLERWFPQMAKEKRRTIAEVIVSKLWMVALAFPAWLAAVVVAMADAVVARRPWWAVGHLLVGVTVPIYALTNRLNARLAAKLGVAAGWLLVPALGVHVHLAIAKALAATAAAAARPPAG